MKPIPYEKCISSFRIWWYSPNQNGINEFGYTIFGSLDKINLACEYHRQLGVEGYDQDENHTIWLIKNNWYSTDQIERMLSLKSFM